MTNIRNDNSTSTSRTNGDLEYCKELARKSVARAAFHLGMESMSGEALDVMGDILVSYLERIGHVMASSVQSSSRTSAHCNVLDAIHAMEVCTSPAVHQVYFAGESNSSQEEANNNINHWKGLANFLFGSKWMMMDSVNSNGTNSSTNDSNETAGWNAPFLDTISYFPTSTNTNNTTTLFSKQMIQSFHTVFPNKATENENDENNTNHNNNNSSNNSNNNKKEKDEDYEMFVSDGIEHFWGIPSNNSNNKQQATKQSPNDSLSQKSTNAKETSENNNKEKEIEPNQKKQKLHHDNNPVVAEYVPNFLPPFPPEQTYDLKPHVELHGVGMSNVGLSDSKQTNDSKQDSDLHHQQQKQKQQQKQQRDALLNYITTDNPYVVRTSLVQLKQDHHPWGAIPNNNHVGAKDAVLSVPAGRQMDHQSDKTPNSNYGNAVIELYRKRSSRVGSILEGSMDT